jgi:predicted PurR-regulated permease PerM
LILTVDPIQAIYYVIFFLILQQLEGNLIYPHVVGNSVGLPPIWVLLAVTVGGNAMGLIGMLLSIPLGSVIYTLLRKNISRRLTISKIDRKKVL